jgi:Protein of unknown function (DUF3892)
MVTHKATPTSPMRLAIRVDCVTRTDRVSPHHRIRSVGGVGSDGIRWRLSEEAVIAAIENERATFYVEWPAGRRSEIVVAQGLGKRYLKTESDGEMPDRLLSLPDCA